MAESLSETAWDPNLDPWPSRRLPLELQDRVYESNKRTYDAVRRREEVATLVPIKATVALVSGVVWTARRAATDAQRAVHRPAAAPVVNGTFRDRCRSCAKGNCGGMPSYQTANLYLIRRQTRGWQQTAKRFRS